MYTFLNVDYKTTQTHIIICTQTNSHTYTSSHIHQYMRFSLVVCIDMTSTISDNVCVCVDFSFKYAHMQNIAHTPLFDMRQIDNTGSHGLVLDVFLTRHHAFDI